MTSMAAECEIELRVGRQCGVQATGRCSRCGNAFCESHQALTWNGGVYVDKCSACAKEDQARERAKNNELHRHDFSDWREAARLLAASQVPAVQVHDARWVGQRGIFRSNNVERPVPLGRAWIIGNIRWQYSTPGPHGGTDIDGPALTALRELLNDSSGSGRDHLVRVEPDPRNGGYRVGQGGLMGYGAETEASILVRKLLGQIV
jgi:hypothetical protein